MSGLFDALYHAIAGGEQSRRPPPQQEKEVPPNLVALPSHSSPKPESINITHPDTPHPSSKLSRSAHSTSSRSQPYHTANSTTSAPFPPGMGVMDLSHSPVLRPSASQGSVEDMSPFRLANPADVSISSASAGMVSSAFSTPHELLFGPQPTPFVLRRRERRNSGETPSKRPILGFTQQHRNTSMPSMTALIQDLVEEEGNAQIKIGVVEKTEVRLSEWRQEQLARMNTPRVVNNGPPKPIPTLHGPLSLPYARNPSGVDATVADETAYMSHVFGLRGADIKASVGSKYRVSSNSTDTTRSTSGSSLFVEKNKADTSVSTQGSSASAIILPPVQKRPVVIRDPYQHIGIRKGTAVNEVEEKVEIPTITPKVAHVDSPEARNPTRGKGATLSAPASLANSTIKPLTPINAAAASPSSILKAQIVQPTNVALPTIPCSPSEAKAPEAFQTLFVDTMGVSPAEREASAGQFVTPRHINSMMASQAIIDDLAQYVNLCDGSPRASTGVTNAVSSPTANDDNHGSPTVNIGSRERSTSHGKADASANWRSRMSSVSRPSVPNNTPVQSKLYTAGPQGQVPHIKIEDEGVMTIDSLFEKFGGGMDAAPSIKVNPPTPADPAIKETSKTPLGILSPSKRVDVASTTTSTDFGSTSGYNSDPAPKSIERLPSPISSSPSNKSIPKEVKRYSPKSAPVARGTKLSAKGTPGAGKYLKKCSRAAGSKLAAVTKSQAIPEGASDKENEPVKIQIGASPARKGKAAR